MAHRVLSDASGGSSGRGRRASARVRGGDVPECRASWRRGRWSDCEPLHRSGDSEGVDHLPGFHRNLDGHARQDPDLRPHGGPHYPRLDRKGRVSADRDRLHREQQPLVRPGDAVQPCRRPELRHSANHPSGRGGPACRMADGLPRVERHLRRGELLRDTSGGYPGRSRVRRGSGCDRDGVPREPRQGRPHKGRRPLPVRGTPPSASSPGTSWEASSARRWASRRSPKPSGHSDRSSPTSCGMAS